MEWRGIRNIEIFPEIYPLRATLLNWGTLWDSNNVKPCASEHHLYIPFYQKQKVGVIFSCVCEKIIGVPKKITVILLTPPK